MLCVLLDYDEIFIKFVNVEGYLIEIIIIVLRNIIKCKIESFYFFVNSVMNVIIRILNCVFYLLLGLKDILMKIMWIYCFI